MNLVRPILIGLLVAAIAAICCALAFAQSPAPTPVPPAAPSLIAPAGVLLPNVQYPIALANFTTDLQVKAKLVAHPKAGVSLWPMVWGGKSQLLFMAASPGKYDVSAYYPDALGAVQEAEVSVVVGAAADPTPGPGSHPVPGPQPTPPASQKIAAGKLWLICVLPSLAGQTPEQGIVPLSKTLRAAIDARGDHFLWTDPATAPTELAPWVTAAENLGLPVAIIVADGDAAGSCRDSISLANPTPAGVLTFLQKWQAP